MVTTLFDKWSQVLYYLIKRRLFLAF